MLDNPPHTVSVFVERERTDWRGNIVRGPDLTVAPVTVRGFMQPVSASNDVSEGQRATVSYRFIGRNAPTGPWSRVEWVDDSGATRRFAVQGDPTVRRVTAATSHVTVQLSEER